MPMSVLLVFYYNLIYHQPLTFPSDLYINHRFTIKIFLPEYVLMISVHVLIYQLALGTAVKCYGPLIDGLPTHNTTISA